MQQVAQLETAKSVIRTSLIELIYKVQSKTGTNSQRYNTERARAHSTSCRRPKLHRLQLNSNTTNSFGLEDTSEEE